VPVAAATVIGALLLIQGSGEPARNSASSTAPAAPGPSPSRGEQGKGTGARLIAGDGFQIALPAGWKQVPAPHGADFAAQAPGDSADATLSIEHHPSLSFSAFEARSISQLRQKAGGAHVVDETKAPTAEGSVVTLAADSPPGKPELEVTLRASGPDRYYLATTTQPDASSDVLDGADLIRNSLVPIAGASG